MYIYNFKLQNHFTRSKSTKDYDYVDTNAVKISLDVIGMEWKVQNVLGNLGKRYYFIKIFKLFSNS